MAEPRSVLETVFDILGRSGISFQKSLNAACLTCPRCNKKNKLYIYKKGNFRCFYCCGDHGARPFSGSCEWALFELTGERPSDIKDEVFGVGAPLAVFLDADIRNPYEEEEEDGDVVYKMDPVYPPLDFVHLNTEAGQKGLKYLESRGIPAELAMSLDIRYHPMSQRVVFPVKRGDDWLGWQSRIVVSNVLRNEETGAEGEVPKALTSRGLPKERLFMFQDSLRGSPHAILCEGPVDAIHASKCGGAIASLGKMVSETQLQILRNSGILRLYLALDPDAYKEAHQIVRKMSSDFEIYDMRPPKPYKDIGEMPMDEVVSLMITAPKVTPSYIFAQIKDHYDGR